jgi:DNA-binding protein HU-beta
VTKKQADAVLTAAIETIIDVVSEGDKVTLVGFGSFVARECLPGKDATRKLAISMEIPATRRLSSAG